MFKRVNSEQYLFDRDVFPKYVISIRTRAGEQLGELNHNKSRDQEYLGVH